MSDLLPRAFTALGMGPTRREIALVAQTLRDSGDEAVLVIERAACRREEFRALVELAEAAGSSAFVALDLTTYVTTSESGVRE